MEIILCDKNKDVVSAWHHFFDRTGKVTIVTGDVLAQNASAIVVPTNSFAIMDSGIGAQINKLTDGDLETRARKFLQEKYAGEMPVGVAEVMATAVEQPPAVVTCPVLRVPGRSNTATVNPFLSTRAALRAVASQLRTESTTGLKRSLESLAFVGMGTGEGGIAPATAAYQMYEAYCQIVLGQIPNFATVEAANAHDQELKKSRFM